MYKVNKDEAGANILATTTYITNSSLFSKGLESKNAVSSIVHSDHSNYQVEGAEVENVEVSGNNIFLDHVSLNAKIDSCSTSYLTFGHNIWSNHPESVYFNIEHSHLSISSEASCDSKYLSAINSMYNDTPIQIVDSRIEINNLQDHAEGGYATAIYSHTPISMSDCIINIISSNKALAFSSYDTSIELINKPSSIHVSSYEAQIHMMNDNLTILNKSMPLSQVRLMRRKQSLANCQ